MTISTIPSRAASSPSRRSFRTVLTIEQAEDIRAKAEKLRSKASGLTDETAREELRRQAQDLARQVHFGNG